MSNSSYMIGKLLIAMPAMSDTRFHRAVIFICAHDDQGAMGLVVNKTMDGIDMDELLDQLDLEDSDIKLKDLNMPIFSGGPVEQARGFLLHSADFKQKETILVDDNFSVTGTVSALKEILKGCGPEQNLFMLGYAGWSAGQLDNELKNNAWLAVDADPEIIFAPKIEDKWDLAIAKLGIDPSMLSNEGGRA